MPDYQNGKIYQIIAPNGCKYIGSTTQEIRKRLIAHKTTYKSWKKGERKYMTTSFKLFEEYGVDNCKVELIELYPCSSKKELETREGEIIKNTECVNKVVAGQEESVWKYENHERLKNYWKQYYIDNLDKYKERNKRQYQNNKEYNRERHRRYREAKKKLTQTENNLQTQ